MLPSVSDRWSDLQGRKELVIIIKSSFLRVDRLHLVKKAKTPTFHCNRFWAEQPYKATGLLCSVLQGLQKEP